MDYGYLFSSLSMQAGTNHFKKINSSLFDKKIQFFILKMLTPYYDHSLQDTCEICTKT